MKEKLSLLTELIKLASCDKHLRKQEYDFILVISSRLGIDKETLDKLFAEYIEFNITGITGRIDCGGYGSAWYRLIFRFRL